MANESLHVSTLFPSYEKYLSFLQNQPRHSFMIEPSRMDQYTNQVGITHSLGNHVVNRMYGWNKDHGKGVAIVLNNFHQEYHDPSGYGVNICVNDNSLSNNLKVPTDQPERAQFVQLSSYATLSDQEKRWHRIQEVFIPLDNAYLEQLKKEGLVPQTSRTRIWILDKATIAATIEDGGQLGEEALRRICDDIGLAFDFHSGRGKTKGRVGNKVCELEQVRLESLNGDKLWTAMTGTDAAKPFVFSVKVEGHR